MKLLTVALTALLFTSCITERKAVDYMHEHPKVSSAFCATEYPVKEETSVVVNFDTAGARRVQDSLKAYAEKWVTIAQERNVSIDQVTEFVTDLIRHTNYKDSACNATVKAIQAKLAAVPKVDINSLREDIRAELSQKINPCKDSIVYRTVENTAKTASMTIELKDEKARHVKTSWWKDFWMYIAIALAVLNIIQYLLKSKK